MRMTAVLVNTELLSSFLLGITKFSVMLMPADWCDSCCITTLSHLFHALCGLMSYDLTAAVSRDTPRIV